MASERRSSHRARSPESTASYRTRTDKGKEKESSRSYDRERTVIVEREDSRDRGDRTLVVADPEDYVLPQESASNLRAKTHGNDAGYGYGVRYGGNGAAGAYGYQGAGGYGPPGGSGFGIPGPSGYGQPSGSTFGNPGPDPNAFGQRPPPPSQQEFYERTYEYEYSSSSSSSYLDISRQFPVQKKKGVIATFFTAPSEHKLDKQRVRRRRSSNRLLKMNTSSSSSINTDLAYGTGFIKVHKRKERGVRTRRGKERDRYSTRHSERYSERTSERYSDRERFSDRGSISDRQRPSDRQRFSDRERPSDVERPSDRESTKKKSKKSHLGTDAAILATGAGLAALARKQNKMDLREARRTESFKGRESAGFAGALGGPGLLGPERAGRGIPNSKISYGSDTVDEDGWESASDAGSEQSIDTALAFGAGASQLGVGQGGTSQLGLGRRKPTGSFWGFGRRKRKETVVDPRLFGPYNSLHGIVDEPVGFDDTASDLSGRYYDRPEFRQSDSYSSPDLRREDGRQLRRNDSFPSPELRREDSRQETSAGGSRTGPMQLVYPIPTSDPSRFDVGRGSVVSAQHDPHMSSRPAPVPLQQPQPITPVSQSVYEPIYTTRPENDAPPQFQRSNDVLPQRSSPSSNKKSIAGAALAGIAGGALIGAITSDHRDDRSDRDKRREEIDYRRQELDNELAAIERGKDPMAIVRSDQDKLREDLKSERSSKLPDDTRGEVTSGRRDSEAPSSRRDSEAPSSRRDREATNGPRDKRDETREECRARRDREKRERGEETREERRARKEREKDRETRRELDKQSLADNDQEETRDQRRERRREERRAAERGDDRISPKSQTTTDPLAKSVESIDPFQYQVLNDDFATPDVGGTEYKLTRNLVDKNDDTPTVVTVARSPDFAKTRDRSSSVKKDDYDEKYRRERDDETNRELGHVYDETKHSTAPIEAGAIGVAAAMIAAEGYRESRSAKRRDERRSEYGDSTVSKRDRNDGSVRDVLSKEQANYYDQASQEERDRIQEEADRIYRQTVMARKIASKVMRDRSASPEASIVDKYAADTEGPIVRIVTPPGMDDRKKEGPYDAPNADIRPDHEMTPREFQIFRENVTTPIVDRKTRTRAVSNPKKPSEIIPFPDKRPLLTLVRPTPTPSPAPEDMYARSEPATRSAPVEPVQTSRGTSDVVISYREGVQTPATPSSAKSVSWGKDETNFYEVQSPHDHNEISEDDRAISEDDREHESSRSRETGMIRQQDLDLERERDLPQRQLEYQVGRDHDRPEPKVAKDRKPGKVSGWGAIAAAVGVGGTAAAAASEASNGSKSSSRKDSPAREPYEYRGGVVEPKSSSSSGNRRSPPPSDTSGTERRRSPPSNSRGPPQSDIYDFPSPPVNRRSPPSNDMARSERRRSPPSSARDARSDARDFTLASGPVPSDTETPAPHIPGAFDDDIDFAATLAAGLEDTGFDPNIVIEDPTYRRRSSPPGSEKTGSFYQKPFAETVSDLTTFAVDSPGHEGAPPVQGFVEGEVPDTPREERDMPAMNDGEFTEKLSKKEQRKREKEAKRQNSETRAFDITPEDASSSKRDIEEPVDTSKLSKKELKKLEKEAKRRSIPVEDVAPPLEQETPVETPVVTGAFVEEPETYFETPKKSKTKSKKSSSTYDDAPLDSPRAERDERRISVPIDAYDDLTNGKGATEAANDEWDVPKKKKSKRETDRYGSPQRSYSASAPSSDLSSNKKSKDKAKRRSLQWDEVDPADIGLPRSTISEVGGGNESEESRRHEESRRRSKSSSSKRAGSTYDTRDSQGDSIGDLNDYEKSRHRSKSSSSSKRASGTYDTRDRDVDSVISADAGRYDDEERRRHKLRSKSLNRDDDARSIASAPSVYDDDGKKKKEKKGGFFGGLFGSKRDDMDKKQDESPKSTIPKSTRDDFEEPKKKSKKSSRSSIGDPSELYSGIGSQSVGDLVHDITQTSNGNGHAKYDDSGHHRSRDRDRRKDGDYDRRDSKEKESFLGNAGTLGAGAGIVGAAAAIAIAARRQQSKDASAVREFADADEDETKKSQPRRRSIDSIRSLSPVKMFDPEVVERRFRPSIDPQYGDLLPLPPSDSEVNDMEPFDELPSLPESRSGTPEDERLRRQRLQRRFEHSAPPKSPSQSAIPLQFRLGAKSSPITSPRSPAAARYSPVTSPSRSNDVVPTHRNRSRPSLWESSKEYKPLYLVEQTRGGSNAQQEVPEDLPVLPSSGTTSRNSSQHVADDEPTPRRKSVRFEDTPFSVETGLDMPSDLGDSEESTPRASHQYGSYEASVFPSISQESTFVGPASEAPRSQEMEKSVETPPEEVPQFIPTHDKELRSGGDMTTVALAGAALGLSAAAVEALDRKKDQGDDAFDRKEVEDLAEPPRLASPQQIDPMNKDRSSFLLQDMPIGTPESKKGWQDGTEQDTPTKPIRNFSLPEVAEEQSEMTLPESDNASPVSSRLPLVAIPSTIMKPAEEDQLEHKLTPVDSKETRAVDEASGPNLWTAAGVVVEPSQEPEAEPEAVAEPTQDMEQGPEQNEEFAFPKSKKDKKGRKDESVGGETEPLEFPAVEPAAEPALATSEEPFVSDTLDSAVPEGETPENTRSPGLETPVPRPFEDEKPGKKNKKKNNKASQAWEESKEPVVPGPSSEVPAEEIPAEDPQAVTEPGESTSKSGGKKKNKNKKRGKSGDQVAESMPAEGTVDESTAERGVPTTDDFVSSEPNMGEKEGEENVDLTEPVQQPMPTMSESQDPAPGQLTTEDAPPIDLNAESVREAPPQDPFLPTIPLPDSPVQEAPPQENPLEEPSLPEIPVQETRRDQTVQHPVRGTSEEGYFPSAAALHSPMTRDGSKESKSGGYFPSAVGLAAAAVGALGWIAGSNSGSTSKSAKTEEDPGREQEQIAEPSTSGTRELQTTALPEEEPLESTDPAQPSSSYDEDQLELAKQLQSEFSGGKKSKKDKKKRRSVPVDDFHPDESMSLLDTSTLQDDVPQESQPAEEPPVEMSRSTELPPGISAEQLELARQMREEFASGSSKKSKKDKKKRQSRGSTRDGSPFLDIDSASRDASSSRDPEDAPEVSSAVASEVAQSTTPAAIESPAAPDGFEAGYKEDQLSLARQLQAEFSGGSKKGKKDKKKARSSSQTPKDENYPQESYSPSQRASDEPHGLEQSEGSATPAELDEMSRSTELPRGISAEPLELAKQMREEFAAKSGKKGKKDKKRGSLLRTATDSVLDFDSGADTSSVAGETEQAGEAVTPTAEDDFGFSSKKSKKDKKTEKRKSQSGLSTPSELAREVESDLMTETVAEEPESAVSKVATSEAAIPTAEDDFGSSSKKSKKDKKKEKRKSQSLLATPDESAREVEADQVTEPLAVQSGAVAPEAAPEVARDVGPEMTPETVPEPATPAAEDEFASTSKKSKKDKKKEKRKSQSLLATPDESPRDVETDQATEPVNMEPETVAPEAALQVTAEVAPVEIAADAADEFALPSKQSKKGKKKDKRKSQSGLSTPGEPVIEPEAASIASPSAEESIWSVGRDIPDEFAVEQQEVPVPEVAKTEPTEPAEPTEPNEPIEPPANVEEESLSTKKKSKKDKKKRKSQSGVSTPVESAPEPEIKPDVTQANESVARGLDGEGVDEPAAVPQGTALEEPALPEVPEQETIREEAPLQEPSLPDIPLFESPLQDAPVEEVTSPVVPSQEFHSEESSLPTIPLPESPLKEAAEEKASLPAISVPEFPAQESPVAEAPPQEPFLPDIPLPDSPVEETPVHVTLVEEASPQEPFVQTVPLSESPLQEPSSLKTPTEAETALPTIPSTRSVEEAAVQKTASQEEPSFPTIPLPESPVRRTTPEETLLPDAAVQEVASQEATVPGIPLPETPSQETPVQEQAMQEQPVPETSVPESVPADAEDEFALTAKRSKKDKKKEKKKRKSQSGLSTPGEPAAEPEASSGTLPSEEQTLEMGRDEPTTEHYEPVLEPPVEESADAQDDFAFPTKKSKKDKKKRKSQVDVSETGERALEAVPDVTQPLVADEAVVPPLEMQADVGLKSEQRELPQDQPDLPESILLEPSQAEPVAEEEFAVTSKKSKKDKKKRKSQLESQTPDETSSYPASPAPEPFIEDSRDIQFTAEPGPFKDPTPIAPEPAADEEFGFQSGKKSKKNKKKRKSQVGASIPGEPSAEPAQVGEMSSDEVEHTIEPESIELPVSAPPSEPAEEESTFSSGKKSKKDKKKRKSQVGASAPEELSRPASPPAEEALGESSEIPVYRESERDEQSAVPEREPIAADDDFAFTSSKKSKKDKKKRKSLLSSVEYGDTQPEPSAEGSTREIEATSGDAADFEKPLDDLNATEVATDTPTPATVKADDDFGGFATKKSKKDKKKKRQSVVDETSKDSESAVEEPVAYETTDAELAQSSKTADEDVPTIAEKSGDSTQGEHIVEAVLAGAMGAIGAGLLGHDEKPEPSLSADKDVADGSRDADISRDLRPSETPFESTTDKNDEPEVASAIGAVAQSHESHEQLTVEPVSRDVEFNPTREEPIPEQHITPEPIVEEPITAEPVPEEYIAEESIPEQHISEQPVVEEPAPKEHIFLEPIIHETTIREPIIAEPVPEMVVEEPTPEQPVIEETVADKNISEDPIPEQHILGPPDTEDPIAQDQSGPRDEPETNTVLTEPEPANLEDEWSMPTNKSKKDKKKRKSLAKNGDEDVSGSSTPLDPVPEPLEAAQTGEAEQQSTFDEASTAVQGADMPSEQMPEDEPTKEDDFGFSTSKKSKKDKKKRGKTSSFIPSPPAGPVENLADQIHEPAIEEAHVPAQHNDEPPADDDWGFSATKKSKKDKKKDKRASLIESSSTPDAPVEAVQDAIVPAPEAIVPAQDEVIVPSVPEETPRVDEETAQNNREVSLENSQATPAEEATPDDLWGPSTSKKSKKDKKKGKKASQTETDSLSQPDTPVESTQDDADVPPIPDEPAKNDENVVQDNREVLPEEALPAQVEDKPVDDDFAFSSSKKSKKGKKKHRLASMFENDVAEASPIPAEAPEDSILPAQAETAVHETSQESTKIDEEAVQDNREVSSEVALPVQTEERPADDDPGFYSAKKSKKDKKKGNRASQVEEDIPVASPAPMEVPKDPVLLAEDETSVPGTLEEPAKVDEEAVQVSRDENSVPEALPEPARIDEEAFQVNNDAASVREVFNEPGTPPEKAAQGNSEPLPEESLATQVEETPGDDDFGFSFSKKSKKDKKKKGKGVVQAESELPSIPAAFVEPTEETVHPASFEPIFSTQDTEVASRDILEEEPTTSIPVAAESKEPLVAETEKPADDDFEFLPTKKSNKDKKKNKRASQVDVESSTVPETSAEPADSTNDDFVEPIQSASADAEPFSEIPPQTPEAAEHVEGPKFDDDFGFSSTKKSKKDKKKSKRASQFDIDAPPVLETPTEPVNPVDIAEIPSADFAGATSAEREIPSEIPLETSDPVQPTEELPADDDFGFSSSKKSKKGKKGKRASQADVDNSKIPAVTDESTYPVEEAVAPVADEPAQLFESEREVQVSEVPAVMDESTHPVEDLVEPAQSFEPGRDIQHSKTPGTIEESSHPVEEAAAPIADEPPQSFEPEPKAEPETFVEEPQPDQPKEETPINADFGFFPLKKTKKDKKKKGKDLANEPSYTSPPAEPAEHSSAREISEQDFEHIAPVPEALEVPADDDLGFATKKDKKKKGKGNASDFAIPVENTPDPTAAEKHGVQDDPSTYLITEPVREPEYPFAIPTKKKAKKDKKKRKEEDILVQEPPNEPAEPETSIPEPTQDVSSLGETSAIVESVSDDCNVQTEPLETADSSSSKHSHRGAEIYQPLEAIATGNLPSVVETPSILEPSSEDRDIQPEPPETTDSSSPSRKDRHRLAEIYQPPSVSEAPATVEPSSDHRNVQAEPLEPADSSLTSIKNHRRQAELYQPPEILATDKPGIDVPKTAHSRSVSFSQPVDEPSTNRSFSPPVISLSAPDNEPSHESKLGEELSDAGSNRTSDAEGTSAHSSQFSLTPSRRGSKKKRKLVAAVVPREDVTGIESGQLVLKDRAEALPELGDSPQLLPIASASSGDTESHEPHMPTLQEVVLLGPEQTVDNFVTNKPAKKSKKSKKRNFTPGKNQEPDFEKAFDVSGEELSSSPQGAESGQSKSVTPDESALGSRSESRGLGIAGIGGLAAAGAALAHEATKSDDTTKSDEPTKSEPPADQPAKLSKKQSKKEKRKKNVDRRSAQEDDLFDDPQLWDGADRRQHEEVEEEEARDDYWSGNNQEEARAEELKETKGKQPAEGLSLPKTFGPGWSFENLEGSKESTRDVKDQTRSGPEDQPPADFQPVNIQPPGEAPEQNWNDKTDEFLLTSKRSKSEIRKLGLLPGDLTPVRLESPTRENLESPCTPITFPTRRVENQPLDEHRRLSTPLSARHYGAPDLSPLREEEDFAPASSDVSKENISQRRQQEVKDDVNRDSGLVTGSPMPSPKLRHLSPHEPEPVRDSAIHLRDHSGPPSKRNSAVASTDEALQRLSWPAVNEEAETVDLERSLRPKAEPESPPQGHDDRIRGVKVRRSPEQRHPEQHHNEKEIRAETPTPRKVHDIAPALGAVAGGGGVAALARSFNERAASPINPPPHRSPSAQSHRSVSVNRLHSKTPESSVSVNRLQSKTPEIRPPSSASVRSLGNRSATSTPPLRRSGRKFSGDLRSLSQRSTSNLNGAGGADQASQLSQSSDKSNPVANEGRPRVKEMADVYDGYGEGRIGSPRSPTRPHSMRRRQSLQILELDAQLEKLAAENRALSEAKIQAEHHASISQRAQSVLADRDAEIDSLKQTLDWLHKEVTRLSEVNDGLQSANATLSQRNTGELEQQHAQQSRELEMLQSAHLNLRNEAAASVQEKDNEIARLRQELEAAKQQIRDMQRQILASKGDEFLVVRDEDYFDNACQSLCQHVQQWVLRFSKFSDMRACRLTSEINNDKILDRLDNSVLDGSDVDSYLADRVRRRDVFMSMSMNMIWEFVFTRYLFGMDREQRQKLKALEKHLSEVGPASAVHQWRAVTLTLLARRDAFQHQRSQDTEAVAAEIFSTLSGILPPPSNKEDILQEQLQKVLKSAVDLSIEMRCQRAEYMMLPPLSPEYDDNGDIARKVAFNASLMNERSGDTVSNEELEQQQAIVRVVLFPLVVKRGDDTGAGDEEIVVCPAQVLVAKAKKSVRMLDPGSQSMISMQSSMPTELRADDEDDSMVGGQI